MPTTPPLNNGVLPVLSLAIAEYRAARIADTAGSTAATVARKAAALADGLSLDPNFVGLEATHPSILTAYVSDFFNDRTVAAGSMGSAPLGGAYTLGGTFSSMSVAGGFGIHAPAAGSTLSAYLASISMLAGEVRSVVRLTAIPATQKCYTMIRVRGIDASNYYRVVIAFATDGTVDLTVYNVVAGVSTAVNLTGPTGSGLAVLQLPRETLVPDQDYNFRVQVEGTTPTTIRAKFWRVGTAEPFLWDGTATDSTVGLQAAGAVGLMTFRVTGETAAPVAKYSLFTANAIQG